MESQLFLCREYGVNDGVLMWFDLILNGRQSQCFDVVFVYRISCK